MSADEVRPARQAEPDMPTDAAAWAAQAEAVWAAGSAGWDALAAEWGVPVTASAPDPRAAAAPAQCWWDAPPWCGQIADAEFRAIVAAYVAHHGSYTPDLPAREPSVLREWLRAKGYASAAAPRAAA